MKPRENFNLKGGIESSFTGPPWPRKLIEIAPSVGLLRRKQQKWRLRRDVGSVARSVIGNL